MQSLLDSSAWPQRQFICLGCRALRERRGRCDCGGDVVELGSGGRLMLVERVWGPPTALTRVNRPAGAFLVVGMLTLAFSLLGFYGVGVAASLGFFFAAGLVRAIDIGTEQELWRERTRALPAADHRRSAKPPASPFVGRVRAVTVCIAPMSLRYCVAYAVELRDEHGRDTYLRDAATIGFEVVSNDGRVVRVPSGPVVLRCPEAREIILDEQIRAYLHEHDPEWRPDRYDPFPYGTALEAVVCEGDVVEIHNSLLPAYAPDAERVGYREMATQLFDIDGTPRIEQLPRRA